MELQRITEGPVAQCTSAEVTAFMERRRQRRLQEALSVGRMGRILCENWVAESQVYSSSLILAELRAALEAVATTRSCLGEDFRLPCPSQALSERLGDQSFGAGRAQCVQHGQHVTVAIDARKGVKLTLPFRFGALAACYLEGRRKTSACLVKGRPKQAGAELHAEDRHFR